jgi:dTDP-4-amino-4,6-dideoxygalactose transaminase
MNRGELPYGPRRVAAHPTLDWCALAPGGSPFRGSVIEARRSWLLVSGRYALAHALRAMHAAPGDEILLPAYHCRAMVTPLEYLKLVPVFYAIRPDFNVDLESIERLLSPRARALVVVHYFGFPAALAELQRLCDARGVPLIEDCAHALYSQVDGVAVGGVGDYAIASPMKFAPALDGGALVAHARAAAPAICSHGAGLRYQSKAVLDVLERGAQARTVTGLNTVLRAAVAVKRRIRARRKFQDAKEVARSVAVPAAVEGGFDFDPRWLDVDPALLSRWIMRGARREPIAAARRSRFAALAQALRGLGGVELPLPELPEGAVPYVFPILVRDGERAFWSLWNAGVQVFRWELTETQSCPVTRRYARGLLQLPCHQTLDAAAMAELITGVRRCFQ